MAAIHLDQIGHSYGTAVYALEKTDLHFDDGKTFALLGPSGCGKTTMLNIISGLLTPSDGRVLLGGTDVTRVKTAERNIAQVFQFPVVYQSKTVFENLAFPLHCRGWDKPRITRRVGEIAELLGLCSRLDQSARRLTADEKQLISLGRGLVRDDVAALLMDEPLTVIDPHMKFDLRRRIKQANDQTRHTVVYVTHDQNEAMTFADEILVMNAGRVVQRGTPQELFERPRDLYVANFIGSPGMNFVQAERGDGDLRLAGVPVVAGSRCEVIAPRDEVVLGIRPEHIVFAKGEERGIPASIVSVEDHGSLRVVDVTVGSNRLRMKVGRDVALPSEQVRIRAAAARIRLYVGGLMVS
ncbi:ABC transporter ATP-binding protein [Ensifer sp. 4252]|uniref:ABC transporter ATP-binding protein n=1 Tax=Ensifer sp. 4252 TaxID=3373915 RepID=UPI003D1A2EBC